MPSLLISSEICSVTSLFFTLKVSAQFSSLETQNYVQSSWLECIVKRTKILRHNIVLICILNYHAKCEGV